MKHTLSPPLNQAQMMVLQVVKEQYNEQDLDELRQLLIEFNHRKMQEHLDETVAQKQYKIADFEQMLNSHNRKKR